MAINKQSQLNNQIFPAKQGVTTQAKIGFIGFGEVTYHFVKGFYQDRIDGIQIYSRSLSEPEKTEYHQKRAETIGAKLKFSLKELISSSDIIISSVRGDVSLEVATQAAQFLKPGQIFADLNNAIPSVKIKSSKIINEKGAKFVDIALLELPIQVMHKSLMYVSGDGAKDFMRMLDQFNLNIKYISDQPGKAAMIKALVNVFMKGLQGVYLEFAVSALKAGIDLDLLEPLLITPVQNLPREKDMALWIIRGALLAERKTNEMKEVMEMMHDLDVNPIMLKATVERLNWVKQFKLNRYFDATLPVTKYQKIIEKIMQISEDENIAVQ